LAPFRKLTEFEIDALPDEEILEYIRGARRRGELEAASTALAILTYRHMSDIEARVRRKAPAHLVEEIASTAFMAAIVAALRGPEIKISFRAWLFTIVDRRGIADYFRKHEDDPAVGLLPNEHDGDEDVWGEMMASAEETGYVGTMQIIERTLGELSTVHQAVVELHIFQAFSAKETAELVNERPDAEAEGTAMTENNVNAIASRFRKRLRVNLDLDESDTEPER
jgi:DNA-directed RNA polymerase specialized sigma24 family protein